VSTGRLTAAAVDSPQLLLFGDSTAGKYLVIATHPGGWAITAN